MVHFGSTINVKFVCYVRLTLPFCLAQKDIRLHIVISVALLHIQLGYLHETFVRLIYL